MPKVSLGRPLSFLLVVSAFGIIMTCVIALNPSTQEDYGLWRKPIVGTAFTVLCVSGLFAALSPRRCSGTIGHGRVTAASQEGSLISGRGLYSKGHHIDCGKFAEHTIIIRERRICAACTGLALGALSVLNGVVLRFFLELEILQNGSYLLAVGEACIVLGLAQFRFKGYRKLLVNGLFVWGAFLVLIGVDGINKNLTIDFYTLGVILVWILTRISLSRWDHQRICSDCPQSCYLSEVGMSKRD